LGTGCARQSAASFAIGFNAGIAGDFAVGFAAGVLLLGHFGLSFIALKKSICTAFINACLTQS
jgi:hypothetical protein